MYFVTVDYVAPSSRNEVESQQSLNEAAGFAIFKDCCWRIEMTSSFRLKILAPISEDHVDSVLLWAGSFSTIGGFGSKINVLNDVDRNRQPSKLYSDYISTRLEDIRPVGQKFYVFHILRTSTSDYGDSNEIPWPSEIRG